jgi:Xaa-Pro aminopeptidase
MKSLFNSDFFMSNRQRLREVVGADMPIIVTANGLLQRNSDNAYPFAQDSNFWYLTGVNEPDILLVMLPGEEFLIVPGRTASREAFDGTLDIEELGRISGVTTVCFEEEGWQRFQSVASTYKAVATPAALPQYVEQFGLYTNPSRVRLESALEQHVPDLELQDIRKELANLRMVKQEPELAALRQAIHVTEDSLTLLTVKSTFQAFHSEYEFEADLTREFRMRGASGHAFAPIVAGGKRACTLHNVSNEATFELGTLVVIDVGAEVEQYAADITRTRVYGQPSKRQHQIFDAVIEVQDYALTLLKPGVLLKPYEQAVETYMGKTLQKLGLIKLTGDAEKDHELIRKFYPHATSHFLGLDVHDVGDYERPLEPGMVLTCEPGIYIPDEGIGVRIEDDILITESGNTVLSAALPKALM